MTRPLADAHIERNKEAPRRRFVSQAVFLAASQARAKRVRVPVTGVRELRGWYVGPAPEGLFTIHRPDGGVFGPGMYTREQLVNRLYAAAMFNHYAEAF